MSASRTAVTIGDGKDWHFVNGAWADGDDGGLVVPPDVLNADGRCLQGVHFAFNRKLCYGNCTVRFDFQLSGHTDAGVILRARDESHFYLLHFPNCGQASRSQHFWVALSKMDESGYLRLIKMEMVRRVPSTNDTPLRAKVRIRGSRITVRVGDYGQFEAEDTTYAGPGCVGLYLFGAAQISNVRVKGEPAAHAPLWHDNIQQPIN